MPSITKDFQAFPTGHCPGCDRQVLTCLDLDGDREVRRCVHCDGIVIDNRRWIDAEELKAEGYRIEEPAAKGGCGSGGCGSCALRRSAAG